MGKLRLRSLLPVLFLITISLFAGGCLNATQATLKKPVPAESVDTRVVAANNGFGFNLFRELEQADPGQNVFISPASVAMALAMTYNGADGATIEDMAKTLGLQGMSLAEVNRANADMKTILENPDPGVRLTIANSLWARQGIDFKPEFVQRNRDYYAAEIETLDFSQPGAANTINNWVKKNTGGKIDKIVKSIEANDIMFLINAIYFKGNWADKFDQSKTKERLIPSAGRYAEKTADDVPNRSIRLLPGRRLPDREDSLRQQKDQHVCFSSGPGIQPYGVLPESQRRQLGKVDVSV